MAWVSGSWAPLLSLNGDSWKWQWTGAQQMTGSASLPLLSLPSGFLCSSLQSCHFTLTQWWLSARVEDWGGVQSTKPEYTHTHKTTHRWVKLSLVSSQMVCREASQLTLSLSFTLRPSRGIANDKQRLVPKKPPRHIISEEFYWLPASSSMQHHFLFMLIQLRLPLSLLCYKYCACSTCHSSFLLSFFPFNSCVLLPLWKNGNVLEQEARRRFSSLIKLLGALQSIHGCGGESANNYCDVEKSQHSCLISRN